MPKCWRANEAIGEERIKMSRQMLQFLSIKEGHANAQKCAMNLPEILWQVPDRVLHRVCPKCLKKNVPLDLTQFKQLKRHKNMRGLASKRTSLKEKHCIISQRGKADFLACSLYLQLQHSVPFSPDNSFPASAMSEWSMQDTCTWSINSTVATNSCSVLPDPLQKLTVLFVWTIRSTTKTSTSMKKCVTMWLNSTGIWMLMHPVHIDHSRSDVPCFKSANRSNSLRSMCPCLQPRDQVSQPASNWERRRWRHLPLRSRCTGKQNEKHTKEPKVYDLNSDWSQIRRLKSTA